MVLLELRFRYCISLSGALKWAEMMVSAVVVGLVLWEVVKTGDPEKSNLLHGETYTCVTGVFTFIVVFILLIIYFCICGNDHRCSPKRRLFATVVYTLLVLMWIAAAGVEVWYSVDSKKDLSKHAYNRRPAAAAFCFINLLCCCGSLYLAQFVDM